MDDLTVIDKLLSPEAHALRPVRVVNNVAIHYTATTFPNGPRAGCELYLRRMECFGYLVGVPGDKLEDLWVDVLDVNGDILQEWPINRNGMEYLRRTFRFVREA
ncbi:hypothetical protein ACLIIZ_03225 [Azonexus caeni]|uniref:hypothetical protein n=1 Tax=Azonexus caeni TaxID=266126 RepID=UPI003A8B0D95